MIKVHKILNRIYDGEATPYTKPWKDMAPRTGIRGHTKKLFPQRAHTELKKNAFFIREVNYRNRLLEETL